MRGQLAFMAKYEYVLCELSMRMNFYDGLNDRIRSRLWRKIKCSYDKILVASRTNERATTINGGS